MLPGLCIDRGKPRAVHFVPKVRCRMTRAFEAGFRRKRSIRHHGVPVTNSRSKEWPVITEFGLEIDSELPSRAEKIGEDDHDEQRLPIRRERSVGL
jgi:hypothetical protein